jgi:hypothetical protein
MSRCGGRLALACLNLRGRLALVPRRRYDSRGCGRRVLSEPGHGLKPEAIAAEMK